MAKQKTSPLASRAASHEVLICNQPLDLTQLNAELQISQGGTGASVIFTGLVRASKAKKGLSGMTLEHYPGMTETLIEQILQQASKRWQLNRMIVAHRVGYLALGEPIVFIGCSARHRKEAFESAQYIMDYLKNKATFWKKEHYKVAGKQQTIWVDVKPSDLACLDHWQK